MIIKYTGHSCFKILDEETGYSIVFDPYKPNSVKGFGKIRDAASEVLCTHDHFDHNYKKAISIEPKDVSPFEVRWIDTFHDPKKGALRGENRIYVVTHKATGEKLVHYGDIGEVLDDLLTDENLELLRDADIALVPVGGVYTYDRKEALDLIEALFCEVNPIPVKTAMNLMGMEVGPLRGPLCDMEEKNLERLSAAMKAYGLIR